LLWFVLILHFFVQSSILLLVAWSFIEAITGSSCVAKITVSYEVETYEFWIVDWGGAKERDHQKDLDVGGGPRHSSSS
jgi:hypothetical protein